MSKAAKIAPMTELWLPIDANTPKDQELLLSWPGGDDYSPIITTGEWDDDRHAKAPQPHWAYRHWPWGKRHARANQPTHYQLLGFPLSYQK